MILNICHEKFSSPITKHLITHLFLIITLLLPFTQQSQFCTTSNTNITTCYPCHYKCKQCNGLTQYDCISCSQQYILFNNQCVSCGDNCKSCKNIVDITKIDINYIQTQCQTCNNGFYLSQSTGKCLKCPKGASTCTLSAIQSCSPAYYQQNGICQPCKSNCQTCVDSNTCYDCLDNYFLNTSTSSCQQCKSNCRICSDSLTCDSCADGFYGTNCQNLCQQNCAICDSGICFVCKQNFYLINNNCQYLGILCQNGIQLSSCQQCISDISYMIETNIAVQAPRCSPFYTVHDENRIYYSKAINDQNKFSTNLSTIDNVTLVYCPDPLDTFIVYTQTGNLFLIDNIDPSYKLSIVFQIFVQNSQGFLTISSPAFLYNESINYILDPSKRTAFSCNNTKNFYIISQNIQVKVSNDKNVSLQNLQIQFSLYSDQNNTSSIPFGISQVYIQAFRCLVQNCLICKSSYTCQICISPYKLENNQCTRLCEEGYYYTYLQATSQMTCTLQCPKSFYPIREDYTCQKCIWPCIQCQNQNKCLKCYRNQSSNTSSGNATFSQDLNSSNYYLYNYACVLECPVSYYANQLTNYCQQCIFPCLSCLSQRKCTSCQVGYLNEVNFTCNIKCPSGRYSNFTTIKCQLCQQPCLECHYTSNKCDSCIEPYYFHSNNNSCLSTCPDQYFESIKDIKFCQKCQFPCRACLNISTNCTSCSEGYLYQTQNKCYSKCPTKFYSMTDINLNNLCSPCKNNCETCSDEFVCLSCLDGFKYLESNKTCILDCTKDTFQVTKIDPSNLTKVYCQQCQPPCLECLNKTYCMSCTGLLFLNHLGQCLLECPIGTFIFYNSSIEERQCILCNVNCLNCISLTNCYQCNDGWYLFESICYTQCPIKTFQNQNGYKYCQLCEYPCESCLSQFKCTSCSTGFLLEVINFKCVEFCVQGFYQNVTAQSCLACNEECYTCVDDPSNCTACSTNYFYNQQLKKCQKTCPIYTYYQISQKMCKQCQYPCKECYSYRSCKSCYNKSQLTIYSNFSVQNVFLFHQCIISCPSSYYQVTIIEQNMTTCIKCQSPCEECINSSTTCTKCKPFYISFVNLTSTSINSSLVNYTKSNDSVIQCLLSCPKGYFAYNYQCQLCQQPCSQCTSAFFCTNCISPLFLFIETCVQQCPSSYYGTFQGNILVCLKCSQSCRQCSNNSNNCTKCINNSYIIQLSNNSNYQCVQNCPVNFYTYKTQMKCIQCKGPCLDCYTQIYCKSCIPGYLMQNYKCVLECDNKFYKYEINATYSICTPCQSPCLKCGSKQICYSCIKGYYYLDSNNSCLNKCPKGMFGHFNSVFFVSNLSSVSTNSSDNSINNISNQFQDGICLQCSELCYQCSSYSVCTSCNISGQRSYLQESKCQTSCSQGYFQQNNLNLYYPKICSKCKQNCVICNSFQICQKCISSYLYNNSCLDECPSFYFPSTSFICEKCQSPCKECYNEINCITCVQGYYLYDDICVKKCPLSHWSDLITKKCVLQCPSGRFMNYENKTCLQRCQKFYSQTNQCITSCPSTQAQIYFINQTLGCQRCLSNDINYCKSVKQQLTYKLDYMVVNSKLLLLVKFGTQMNLNLLTNFPLEFNLFSLNFTQKYQIENELDLMFLKSERLSYSNSVTDTMVSESINTTLSQALYDSKIKTKILNQNLVLLQISNLNPNIPVNAISSTDYQNLVLNSISYAISNGYLSIKLKDYLSLLSKQSFDLTSDLAKTSRLLEQDNLLVSDYQNSQKLPFQIEQQKIQILSFNSQQKLPQSFIQTMEVFSTIFSSLILLLIVINLIVDNLKSLYLLVDFSQNLFLLTFIGSYTNLSIYPFFKGFSLNTFVFNLFNSIKFPDNLQKITQQNLWNCSFKQFLYGDSCSFMQNYISLLCCIALGIAIVLVLKLVIRFKPFIQQKFKISHKILYNHINNFYWLFISSIWFISSSSYFFQSQNTSGSTSFIKLISLIVMIICMLLTVFLGYQLLKNIFNASFQQKIFFWGLKCHKCQNQQSNIHFLFLMIRKTILLLSITLASQSQYQQMVFIFLIVLIGIIIISNILANEPFKKRLYQNLILVSQILTVLFYLGIELYIVNQNKIDGIGYVVYNGFLVLVCVTVIVIYLFIGGNETYRFLYRKYKVYKQLDGTNSSSQSSQLSQKLSLKSISQINKTKTKQVQNKDSYTLLPATLSKDLKKQRSTNTINNKQPTDGFQTRNAIQKLNNSLQQSQQFSSSKFEFGESSQSQQFSKPARYLIKIQKKIQEQQ